MMKRVLNPSSAHLLIVAGLLAACDSGPVEGAIEPTEEDAVESVRPSVDALANETHPSAALPGFDLSIELVGSDIELSWADTGAAEYEVWQSTYPYFTPGEFGSYSVAVVAGTQLTVTNGNGDGALNAYYRVQEVSETPQTSTAVGRHRLTLYEGFNKIPLSLETDFTTAQDIFDHTASSVEEGEDVVYVHQWDSTAGGFVTWGSGAPSQDIFEGVPPVVQMDLPEPPPSSEDDEVPSTTIAIAGYVPERNSFSISLSPGHNLVHLPLDFPVINASDLFEAMLPDRVWEVGRWQAGLVPQNGIMVDSVDPDVDVQIRPGDDLYIVLNDELDIDVQWPIDRTRVSGECCEANGNAYCNDDMITECVCAADSYCCSNTWDSLCADEVNSLGCGTCEEEPPPPPPEQGDCCEATAGVSGCTDPGIEACVCAQDDYCCSVAWDSVCVGEVETFGCSDVCVAEA